MKTIVSTIAVLLLVSAAQADPQSEAKAKAALALSKSSRERAASEAVAAKKTGCHTDYEQAARHARETKKPLILWVGMECKDHPEVRSALNDCVHCHLGERYGDSTPRIVFIGSDGVDRKVSKPNLGADAVKRIRLFLGLDVPKPKAAIEETSNRPSHVQTMPQYQYYYTAPAVCVGGA